MMRPSLLVLGSEFCWPTRMPIDTHTREPQLSRTLSGIILWWEHLWVLIHCQSEDQNKNGSVTIRGWKWGGFRGFEQTYNGLNNVPTVLCAHCAHTARRHLVQFYVVFKLESSLEKRQLGWDGGRDVFVQRNIRGKIRGRIPRLRHIIAIAYVQAVRHSGKQWSPQSQPTARPRGSHWNDTSITVASSQGLDMSWDEWRLDQLNTEELQCLSNVTWFASGQPPLISRSPPGHALDRPPHCLHMSTLLHMLLVDNSTGVIT